jgi:hypothetical protein
LPAHCMCRGLLLHLFTLEDTHARAHMRARMHMCVHTLEFTCAHTWEGHACMCTCACMRTHWNAHAHTLGRAPMDKWLVYHRDLYLTTHNSQETDIHVPLLFKPAYPASKRPQTHLRPPVHQDRLRKT